MSNFQGFRGALRIMSIEVNDTYLPVACLESYDFTERITMHPTTSRAIGWETSLPGLQNYDINFSGFQINTAFPGADGTRISYDYLRFIKREKQRINWRIESSDNNQLIGWGKGYITALSENASTGEMVSFDGNMVGYGKVDPVEKNFIFSDMNNAKFSNDDNFILKANPNN